MEQNQNVLPDGENTGKEGVDFMLIDNQNTWAKITTMIMFKHGIEEFRFNKEDEDKITQANPSMLCKFEGDDFVVQLLTQEQAQEMLRLQEVEKAYQENLSAQEQAAAEAANDDSIEQL